MGCAQKLVRGKIGNEYEQRLSDWFNETVKKGNALADIAEETERAFKKCLAEEKNRDIASRACICFSLFAQGFHREFGCKDSDVTFNIDCEEAVT